MVEQVLHGLFCLKNYSLVCFDVDFKKPSMLVKNDWNKSCSLVFHRCLMIKIVKQQFSEVVKRRIFPTVRDD